MKAFLVWDCWGLPFGFSGPDTIGSNKFVWAFSIGPIHILKLTSKEA